MKWSLKLGSFGGIAVFVHWTFVLLIGWIFLMHLGSGETMAQALAGVGFILALFACVVLHEFGHALVAKRYGVRTRDITLLPIGGVARLERIPNNPMQEFWVAVAGPMVNVVIAALIFTILVIEGEFQVPASRWTQEGFLVRLFWINLLIVAFNMLPAFPMDGGRVLRALLSIRIGRRRATDIAVNIGQAMAIFFGIVGFFHNPFLLFIGIFVFLGAQAEAAIVKTESALEGLRVRDAMMTRFRTLASRSPLRTAVAELLSGSQRDFPVLENETLVGVLRRDDLVKALADGRGDGPVRNAMCLDFSPASESDNLIRTLDSMSKNPCSTVPVMDGGRITGLLTLENIGELIMVNSALDDRGTRQPLDLQRDPSIP